MNSEPWFVEKVKYKYQQQNMKVCFLELRFI